MAFVAFSRLCIWDACISRASRTTLVKRLICSSVVYQTKHLEDDTSVTHQPFNYASPGTSKTRKISRAMEKYLEKARENESLLRQETEEFELGKRHLANMMGWDPDNVTQEDIDKAIQYLLPSALSSPRARPVMKHPSLIFPKQKSAAFDEEGRPFHCFFYTSKPNFYQILSDAADLAEKAQEHEVEQIKAGKFKPDGYIELLGTQWFTKEELQMFTIEKISEDHHKQFVAAMEFLVNQPYGFMHRDFIMKHRSALMTERETVTDLPSGVEYDDQGRMYAEAHGIRKRYGSKVRVYPKGSGRIEVDGETIEDFWTSTAKQELLFPFILLNRLGEFDVIGETWYNIPLAEDKGNPAKFPNTKTPHRHAESARAGSVRLAACRALSVLLPPEDVQKLKFAGLLQRDIRRKERKYPAQKGARAKHKWRKR